jgi:hypothetical protein
MESRTEATEPRRGRREKKGTGPNGGKISYAIGTRPLFVALYLYIVITLHLAPYRARRKGRVPGVETRLKPRAELCRPLGFGATNRPKA